MPGMRSESEVRARLEGLEELADQYELGGYDTAGFSARERVEILRWVLEPGEPAPKGEG